MLVLCALAMIGLTMYVLSLTVMQSIVSYGLICLWFLLNIQKLVNVFTSFNPKNIQKMITWLIIGVIPLDALIVVISGHYLLGFVILALLPPCRLLSKKLAMT
jgi:hypothetical protein